jgi:hypothetical protein
MTFDEVEDCFPDGELTVNGDISAQWLHDFAQAVAAKEREACAKVCEELPFRNSDTEYMQEKCAAAIRNRKGKGK